MCGRFTLRVRAPEVAEAFDADPAGLDLPPRFNIAPTDPVAVVRRAGGVAERELARVRWGLIPSWVDDPGDFDLTLTNARSESAKDKPAFREPFRSRRCLVPADGFYEWLEQNGKRPYFVRRRDDGLFAFAGLWDRWEGEDGKALESCTILTCEPDDLVGRLHDRMPVILPRGHWERWLDPAAFEGDLRELLRPHPENEADFEAYPVGKRVNRTANDGPELVEPVGEPLAAGGDEKPGPDGDGETGPEDGGEDGSGTADGPEQRELGL